MRDRTPDIQMFEDTMQILKQGFYEKDGRKIQLKLAAREREEIQVYLPDDVKAICDITNFKPVAVEGDGCAHSCENIDSYALARKRVVEGISKVLVLNLASPVHPGGGVRRGARAQEEDLCRKSSLLLSLESKKASKYVTIQSSKPTALGT